MCDDITVETFLLCLLTHSLTHSMEQSPSDEANTILGGKKLPILQKLKVHCCVHKCPSLVPILS